MTWTHALLRFDDYIIEAAAEGVVKRPWNPKAWERYARFKPLVDDKALPKMTDFANGEIGKRYKYKVLPTIARKILWRIIGKYYILYMYIGRGEVCTSLVDNVFRYVGYDLVPNEPSPFVLPDEISVSELLVQIEGD